MARAGRKRKQGKRTPSGRLSEAGRLVKPSEWVQRQQERFGNHYSSALGRAFASGLLGQGQEAKIRLDAGNRFALRYSKIMGGDSYTCPLDRSVRGNNDNGDRARDRHQQDWLFGIMKKLDEAGARPWLDQLIHKNYTDSGPYWLDALLNGGKQPADIMVLKAAICALDIIAGTEGDSTENTSETALDIPLHVCHGRINA